MFEKTNKTIPLNILKIKKKKEIWPANISEKQLILVIIPNGKKEERHYLAVKKYISVLHGINKKGDLYCSNCLHSIRTGNKLKSHEKACKNKIFMWNFNAIRKG